MGNLIPTPNKLPAVQAAAIGAGMCLSSKITETVCTSAGMESGKNRK